MTVKQTGTGSDIGCVAPDFDVMDSSGAKWKLSDHRGKVVAMVFYPRDETPVCTKQMCSMRDRWADYQATGAEVVGVSVGSVDSHRGFVEHHGLPQRLLADERGEIARLYSVRSILGGSQRAVILIDAAGIIRYRKSVFPIFRPTDDEVISEINRITGAGS